MFTNSLTIACMIWSCYNVDGHLSSDVHQVTLSCGGHTHHGGISAGPPGKRGPMGPVGSNGEKGEQGNPGNCFETCNNMEERLRVLEKQPNDIYKTCPSIVYHFPTVAHSSYVRYLPRFPQITKATLCAWVRVVDETRTAYVASYATSRADNELLWQINLQAQSFIHVVNANVMARLASPRLSWNHICTWIDATSNRAGVYQNGSLTEEKSFSFNSVEGGGVFMTGQEQDSRGGSLDANQALQGSIANLMIWPRVLSASEIHNIAHTCVCPGDYSVSLTPNKVEMVGNVNYEFSGTCLVV